MAERSNAAVLKTVEVKASGGSNPSLSAAPHNMLKSTRYEVFYMTIISRRHPFKFYLALILGSVLMMGLGIFLISLFFNKLGSHSFKPSMYLMLPLSVGIVILGPYTISRYIKNSPGIVIDEKSISFNAKTYFFHEIEKIKFTGKENFPYLIPYPMEATTIFFHNGSRRFIFDDMYENAAQMKSCLQQVVVEKKPYASNPAPTISPSELHAEMFYTYKGSPFFSFRAIIFWSIPVMVVVLDLKNTSRPNNGSVIALLGLSVLWTVLHGWMMHYFEVSQKFLVIRNHIFFWKKKIYLVDELMEVVYETRNKMPNCLRVISKDFKTKLYPAGTLTKNTWLGLKQILEGRGIKVRNECI